MLMLPVFLSRLQFLLDLATMAEKMRKTTTPRCRQLTVETSGFLAHICRGFVDLAKYLLSTGNDYVIFGWFTTDPLEKYFSKLRQGSGGTYFISAQSVIEKVRIHRAKLATRLHLEFDEPEPGHKCNICDRPLQKEECDVIDEVEEIEKALDDEVIMGMLYVAGYIQRKCGYDDSCDTKYYYKTYGNFIDSMNRGGLLTPFDGLVQWSLFSFIVFSSFTGDICRNLMVNVFMHIATKYNFNVEEKHCRTLANIFLKNFSIMNTPGSSKETKLKVLKLS